LDRTTPPEVPGEVKADGAVVAEVRPDGQVDTVDPEGNRVREAREAKAVIVAAEAVGIAAIVRASSRKAMASSHGRWTTATAMADRALGNRVADRCPEGIWLRTWSQ